MLRLAGAVLAIAWVVTGAAAAEPGGEWGAAVYAQRCAACHDAGAARAPGRDDLMRLPAEDIEEALLTGSMAGMAFGMRREEIAAVAAFLAGGAAAEPTPARPISPAPAAPRR